MISVIPANIYIESIGAGPNLVFLHGWGMHSAVWHPVIKRLSKHFTLHLVDLPGMGLSRPTEPYHLHILADKISEMLPANADIVGWSLGGLVAMRIALDKPDLVRRLVLMSTTPNFVNKHDWDAGIAPDVFRNFAENVDADYHNTMTQFLTLQCMGAKDARATVKLLRKKFAERPVPTSQTLHRALNILLDTDLRNEVDRLRKPTLLIHGDRDTLAPVQAAHWMMQNLPMGYLRVIAGASHAPFLSHQEQFVEALIQFLEPASTS
ncbi:MAG: pimeloyl-[acyl-carrier protein] methyl ester esterase [Methylotenera sp.]|nr:MAG: pimeloyl-[acyl-carrier protein] methyl ester esterase [Methylotenera sp.]